MSSSLRKLHAAYLHFFFESRLTLCHWQPTGKGCGAHAPCVSLRGWSLEGAARCAPLFSALPREFSLPVHRCRPHGKSLSITLPHALQLDLTQSPTPSPYKMNDTIGSREQTNFY
ncbi:hypothetical protein CDAR_449421 [Caerostris darwini]|uniref:Uncharacterized protein n=1 Tax=Caerostris darwini TaxID=1538125 RepID=A0AAV4QSX7_9ARAC|nr:hypothetical protein CDAR_449421 [Caerostris darwini]